MLFAACALLALSCLSVTSGQPTATAQAEPQNEAVTQYTPGGPISLSVNPFGVPAEARLGSYVSQERSLSAADSYREVLRARQAKKKDILHRATRRLVAPRAFQSGTACGGFAGQTIVIERSATSYVGRGAGNPYLAFGFPQNGAITATLSSSCQLVDSSGNILGTPSNINGPDIISFYSSQTYASNPSYSALTCRGDENRRISCTRFASNTPGVFCANSNDASAVIGFATDCTSSYPTVPVFFGDAAPA